MEDTRQNRERGFRAPFAWLRPIQNFYISRNAPSFDPVFFWESARPTTPNCAYPAQLRRKDELGTLDIAPPRRHPLRSQVIRDTTPNQSRRFAGFWESA